MRLEKRRQLKWYDQTINGPLTQACYHHSIATLLPKHAILSAAMELTRRAGQRKLGTWVLVPLSVSIPHPLGSLWEHQCTLAGCHLHWPGQWYPEQDRWSHWLPETWHLHTWVGSMCIENGVRQLAIFMIPPIHPSWYHPPLCKYDYSGWMGEGEFLEGFPTLSVCSCIPG